MADKDSGSRNSDNPARTQAGQDRAGAGPLDQPTEVVPVREGPPEVDSPAPSAGQPHPPAPAPRNLLGTTIGSIRILDVLGKGGMGEVYLGVDEKLDRRVALKALRGDKRMDAQARARFTREGKLLSQLEHPHICRVYDLLTGPDEDFLVMELVHGESLREAVRKPLTRAQKLKIVEQVAGVLAAAHEKAIVHRDLKPDNIMLTDEGEVKVLDFGLARSVAEHMAPTVEAEGLTSLGSGASQPQSPGETRMGSIVGTVGYMSPEQARGEPATPASDLYSLGLLIQEIFSGEKPFEKGLSVQELIQKAARGETKPFKDKDSDLLRLVNRLKSPAPAARPPAVDVVERLKWLVEKPRRRRLRLLGIAAVLLLVGLTGAMIALAVRAEREAARANREAETAKQVSKFMVEIFKVSDPYVAQGDTITARAILDQGARRIEEELKDQPLVQATLMNEMVQVYQNLGLYREAEPLARQALATRERLLGKEDVETANSMNLLGVVYYQEGRYEEARPLWQGSLAIREKLHGPDDEIVGASLQNMASLEEAEDHPKEAEALYRRALAIQEKAAGADSPEIIWVLLHYAGLLTREERFSEAEPLYKRACSIADRKLGPGHPDAAAAYNNTAAFYGMQGKLAEAEPCLKKAVSIYEKSLGPEHPVTAGGLFNIGVLDLQTGRPAEAEPILLRSLAIREKSLGLDHPQTADTLVILAMVYSKSGRLKEAEPMYVKLVNSKATWARIGEPNMSSSVENYATLLRATGRPAEAAALESRLKEALAKKTG